MRTKSYVPLVCAVLLGISISSISWIYVTVTYRDVALRQYLSNGQTYVRQQFVKGNFNDVNKTDLNEHSLPKMVQEVDPYAQRHQQTTLYNASGSKPSLMEQIETQPISKSTTRIRQIHETSRPHDVPTDLSLQKLSKAKDTERIGIVGYLHYNPGQIGGHFALEFSTFLYPSWKYVITHRDLVDKVNLPDGQHYSDKFTYLDLVIYCHPQACELLPPDCIRWSNTQEFDNYWNASISNCMYHPEHGLTDNPQYPKDYFYLNTYSFMQDEHFKSIVSRYDWILRTDTDVFISPAILKWRPRYEMFSGQGGYADQFNRDRLPTISAKLGLRHQGITNLGSTWYGRPGPLVKAASLTLNISVYLYNNEFNKSLPGLDVIFTKGTDSNGKWPQWWRPVSTMYGGELALNHIIPQLNDTYRGTGFLDVGSADARNVLPFPHIHCWHGEDDFAKFRFMAQLRALIDKARNLGSIDPIMKDSRVSEAFSDRSVASYSVKDYCSYIAWRGVSQYLPRTRILESIVRKTPQ